MSRSFIFGIAVGVGGGVSVLYLHADPTLVLLFALALFTAFGWGSWVGFDSGYEKGQDLVLGRVYGRYRQARRHPSQWFRRG